VFELRLRSHSLFYQGLVGDSAITMKGSSMTESFDPTTGLLDDDGDVATDGKLTMSGTATIRGDAIASSFAIGSSNLITGARVVDQTPMSFMEVKLPTGLPDLKALSLSGTTRTIVGPGSFQLDKLSLDKSAHLFIDNSAGPVTLYVKTTVTVGGGSKITVADPDPEKFAIYVLSAKSNTVSVTGNGSVFHGVLYAPTSTVTINGTGTFTGAFVAKTLTTDNSARIRYDSSLRGQ